MDYWKMEIKKLKIAAPLSFDPAHLNTSARQN
jgi:hypothetical protein